MYGRTTTTTGATDIDGGLAYIRDEVEPQLRQEKGFRGISCSGDRQSGLVIVLTQWESAADLDASESAAEKVRSDALRILGGQGTVDRYEQLVWETFGAGPRPGAKLFIRSIQMDPSAIDENVEFFRQTALPEMKATSGILGVRNLVNRQTGQGRVATIWIDEESRAEFVAGNAERQVRAENRGITFTGDLSLEVLYASMT